MPSDFSLIGKMVKGPGDEMVGNPLSFELSRVGTTSREEHLAALLLHERLVLQRTLALEIAPRAFQIIVEFSERRWMDLCRFAPFRPVEGCSEVVADGLESVGKIDVDNFELTDKLPPLSHRKEMREAAAKKREEKVRKAAERIERQKVQAEKLSIVRRSGGSPTMPPTQSVDACIEKNFNKYAK